MKHSTVCPEWAASIEKHIPFCGYEEIEFEDGSIHYFLHEPDLEKGDSFDDWLKRCITEGEKIQRIRFEEIFECPFCKNLF